MKMIAVNVGLAREIFYEGKLIRTGVLKAPIAGRVCAGALDIDAIGRRGCFRARLETAAGT
jgi:hypothetical protein